MPELPDASSRYVGRFAPSPTGPLHLGSLFTAVASYLHARRAGGRWLVRIEDIDAPRNVPGAADAILASLDAHGLHWDDSVLYQSSRLDTYAETAERLLEAGLAFRCNCSRRALREKGLPNHRYPGTCRTKQIHEGPTSIRVRVDDGLQVFEDGLQGRIATRLEQAFGDYIVRRRDGLPAYHLAVVIDDALQGISTIVRGVDLLESTGVHRHLQGLIGTPVPQYFHLPVLVNSAGQKLSKQTGAKGLDATAVSEQATTVLALLGLQVPQELRGAPPETLWPWAIGRWDIEVLRARRAIAVPGQG